MIGRYVSSPIDIERVMPSMRHGDWNHGEMSQDQLGVFRPFHEYPPYRTGVREHLPVRCVDASRRLDRRRVRLQRRDRDREGPRRRAVVEPSCGSVAGASRFLIGLVTCFATHGGIPAVARAASRR